MKMKLMLLLVVMILLTALGAIIINILGQKEEMETAKTQDKLQIVTTFYPIHMIGLNIAEQAEDMEVKSLTDLNTGCLHDYQLTTEDMKIISAADVMIINGGGMEGFLEDIVTNYPNLTIIDASMGITMLQNEDHEDTDDEHADDEDGNNEDAKDKESVDELDEGNQEDNDQEKTDQIEAELEEGDHEDESEEGEDDHHDHGEYNPHVWLNPKLYIEQIENVRDGLKDYLNSQNSSFDIDADKLVQLIDQNAQSYIQKVMELDSELDKSLSMVSQSSDQSVTSEEAVIFHDSFAYFIDRIGMSVAFTVPLDSDTALSAYDIGEIINAVRQENIKYLFTEQQYSDSIAKQIEAETEAKLYIIDSIVTGNGSMDSYLDGMRNNIEIIKAAMK